MFIANTNGLLLLLLLLLLWLLLLSLSGPFLLRFPTKNLYNYVYCQYKRAVAVNATVVRNVVPIAVLNYVITQLIRLAENTPMVEKSKVTLEQITKTQRGVEV